MIAGSAPRHLQIHLSFIVVKISLAYNILFGRLGLNKLWVVVSIHYLLMRFPTPQVVGEVHGNQALAKKCYLMAHQVGHTDPLDSLPIKGLDTRDKLTKERGRLVEDHVTIPMHDGDP